jgi:hypothetical protein
MANKKYRFTFQGFDLKLLLEDIPALPVAFGNSESHYVDVELDASQRYVLQNAMVRLGLSGPISEDSRFGIGVYANARLGEWGTDEWSDNTTRDYPIEADVTDPDAIIGAEIKYAVRGKTTGKVQLGKITIIDDQSVPGTVCDHQFTHVAGSGFPGLSFSANLTGNTLNLRVTLTAVGENLEAVLKLFPNIYNVFA